MKPQFRPTIPGSDPVSAPIIATSKSAANQQECITVLKKKRAVHADLAGAGRFRIELDIIDIVQHDPALITNDLRNWMRPLCLSCRDRTENGTGVGGVSRAAAACTMYLQPGLKKIIPSWPVYKGTRFLSPL